MPSRRPPAPQRPAPERAAQAAGGGGARPDDLDAELRRLLLGRDRADLLDRWAQAGPEHLDAAALSDLLPDAVRLRERRDGKLGQALEPAIEAGLRASVERNPQPLADILFPIMGPAIRRAVRQALASSMDTLNRSVNYGLSWRGLRWRVEAWRSGVSFGEVVVRHTVRYRVEQVLLVHRQTGLPLWHVVAPELHDAENADLVSAMLTALRQFVGDSFDVSEDEALDAFQVGDLSVWAETGPDALLAVVVRGAPPASLRDRMCEVLEAIHVKLAGSFDVFEGDAAPFETADEIVRPLLDVEYREDEAPGRAKLWALAALALALVALLAWRVWSERQHEAAFLDALDAEPGLSVLRSERAGGRLVVLGAADPLARAPLALLPDALDRDDVDLRFVSAPSDHPDLLARRARAAFDLPEGVTVEGAPGGVLVARGVADTLWAPEARRLLPLLGARQLDLSGLGLSLDQAIAAVAEDVLSFAEGSAEPLGLDRSRADVIRLAEAARRTGVPVELVIEGHTDGVGTAAENRALSLARAESVRAAFEADGAALDGLAIRTAGLADARAFERGVSPRSRRVTFRVERAGARPTGARSTGARSTDARPGGEPGDPEAP